MKLTTQQIMDFFVSCRNLDKDGIYHGEDPDFLDIKEFAQKVADYVSAQEFARGAREEHKRCVELANKVNPVVGRFLLDKKEYAE